MHNRSYNEQDAIQRLLLFEEGLSRLIELMKIEKKDVWKVTIYNTYMTVLWIFLIRLDIRYFNNLILLIFF